MPRLAVPHPLPDAAAVAFSCRYYNDIWSFSLGEGREGRRGQGARLNVCGASMFAVPHGVELLRNSPGLPPPLNKKTPPSPRALSLPPRDAAYRPCR
jgi:hypothetical protein